MHKLVSNLILYSSISSDSILSGLCDVFRDWETNSQGAVPGVFAAESSRPSGKEDLIHRIYALVKRILDLSTDFGFDENLWQNYLTFEIVSNINSFSVTCEGIGATPGGSVNTFAKNDFRIFKALFDFDFRPIEQDLGIDCFDILENYTAIEKQEKLFDRSVSAIIRALSRSLAACSDENEFFDLISEHYRHYGVGMFGLNRAFRIKGSGDTLEFIPISNADPIRLDDLVGYERQKKELCANTEAFCDGCRANNVLLYGDAGTGKSSSIKAVLNEYFDRGLRMIEIYKHQFPDLANVIARVKKRNYKFIIYIDDLSFEENEVEYKFLKAVIEGGVENRPDNILIYATSNRRHLVKETWKDRSDMEHDGDIHRSETMEEKLSLSSRFGVMINYPSPNKQAFNEIVLALAEAEGLDIDEDTLLAEANKWEVRHGGFSGRTARQYINYMAGKRTAEGQLAGPKTDI